jgi:hypothetical protein
MEEILKRDNKVFDKLLSVLSIALIASILTAVRKGNILENNVSIEMHFANYGNIRFIITSLTVTLSTCVINLLVTNLGRQILAH